MDFYGILLSLLALTAPIHTALVDYYGPEYDNVPEIELTDDPMMNMRTPRVTIDAVSNVLGRLPKWVSAEFDSIVITGGNERLSAGSARSIGSANGVQVEATSPVDALYAIHAYLREFCGTMISWEGQNLPMNGDCMRPKEFERSFKSPKDRYFGNPCTFSYSFAWWDWSHWEKFIDWLALSGFNMVLVPVGQEAIWAKLWTDLGISQKGLNEFFSGPAYLAWHRMGNVQALGGSMTPEYLSSQLHLNKKANGIVLVLPTFAGFVPKEFERKYKNLRYLHNACWNNLNETNSCTTSLHPLEHEFKEISKLFIKKQISIYGDVTDVYSADPFNESPPKHLTDDDVSNMADSIYEGCTAGCANPGRRVPKGRMIILDLQADKRPLNKEFDSFFGHYIVWCLLQNFGGNAQMRGNLGKLNENYRAAVTSEPSMAGMRLTMEGINQNYVVYQYLIDLAWTEEELAPLPWIQNYAAARYGTRSTLQNNAWNMLLSTFYTQVDFSPSPRLFFFDEEPGSNEREERREIYLYIRSKFSQRIRYCFPSTLIEKLGKTFSLLNRTLGGNELFRLDLADVMREVIQNKLDQRIQCINNGYSLQDRKMMKKGCAEIDWILQAREAAPTQDEADSFERQARNQVTLWGPTGQISDYARKEWAGLISKYYGQRWSLFCEVVQSGVHYSQKNFEERLLREVDLPFGHL